MFVWGLYAGFYTHCYFQKLLLGWKGVMCMFGGWCKMSGVCVCTFLNLLKCENYMSEKVRWFCVLLCCFFHVW